MKDWTVPLSGMGPTTKTGSGNMLGEVKTLVTHLDDRGYVYEMLRKDDDAFVGFGQSYISAINPGVVKGFHKHAKQTDYITCVHGQIKLVLVSDIGDAYVLEEHHLGPLALKMITVPPEIYHGWSCIGNEPALVLSISTHLFNPDNPDEVSVDAYNNPWGYKWENKSE